jgi:FemAB-related protein (PEP-CTERM system-associated)
VNQGDLPRALADGIAAATVQTVVRPLRDSDEAAWEAYVARHPHATFFHRAGWRRVIADVMGHRTHYRVAERASQLVGVLPLIEISSALFGRALTSLPFAVYGGALGDDAGIVHALDADALQLARERGVQHLELRNRTPAHPDWPRQDLHVTFRRQIFPEVEANLLAIPRKQRAMVRKAMARNLSGEIEERVDTFFDLYADNQHRHGTPPLPRRWFDALRAEFGSACEILTVRSPAGEAVSAVMSFYFRDEVLPYYAGDRPAARDLAANDFKYWDLMRRACERGLRTFDYGRSKRGTGSFDFKKNWGFEPQPLAYEFALLRRAEIPQHNPANPKYRALIAAWKRMPRGLSDALGPFIVRNLG